MISEKSIFKINIKKKAEEFENLHYGEIKKTIENHLSDFDHLKYDTNIFISNPKITAINIANLIWDNFSKICYVRSFISKQVYSLYCEGNLIYKFWFTSSIHPELKRIFILENLYNPCTSEEEYKELIEKLRETGTRSLAPCFFQDGKFKANNLKIPSLQIFVTENIIITDNLETIIVWAKKNNMKYIYEISPFLNDVFLERLIVGKSIIYNAASYSIIPYFVLNKNKIASLWVSLKFQLITYFLSNSKSKQDYQFNPFEITDKICLFGTNLAGKTRDKYNTDEDSYKPNLITQSKGQIKYFMTVKKKN